MSEKQKEIAPFLNPHLEGDNFDKNEKSYQKSEKSKSIFFFLFTILLLYIKSITYFVSSAAAVS
jgi:hypothetical protein